MILVSCDSGMDSTEAAFLEYLSASLEAKLREISWSGPVVAWMNKLLRQRSTAMDP